MDIAYDTQIDELMHYRFYVYNSVSLYNLCLETVHINNEKILHFDKSMVQSISFKYQLSKYFQSNWWVSGYKDQPYIFKIYIISRYNQLNDKKKKINISQEGDSIRLIRKII